MPITLNGGPAIGQSFTPVQIRTAGKDVVATGTVITADSKNLEFQVADIRLVFSFENATFSPAADSSTAGVAARQKDI